MKKMIFGITLFVGGLLGILTTMLISAIMIQSFGKLNDSTNLLTYLDWFGITPYFICSVTLIVIGTIICIKDIYFNSK